MTFNKNKSPVSSWFPSAISLLESSWNMMGHGDAREGKWRGNWRMEWVASTFTLPRNVVYPALLPLMRTPRLPAVDWTDAPADLNGLVLFAEIWNLVSARVPSHFKRSLTLQLSSPTDAIINPSFYLSLRCTWEGEYVTSLGNEATYP